MKWVIAGWAVLALLVGGLVTGLTAASEEEPAPEQVAAEAGARQPSAEMTETEEIARRVQEIRGMEFEGAVPKVEVVENTELEQAVTKLESADKPTGAEAQRDQKLTTAAGLLLAQSGALPKEAVQQASARFTGKGMLGAYLPEERKVLLSKEISDTDPELAEIVVAHEFARALENEQFGETARRPRPFRDEEAVEVALREGTATLAESEYAVEHLGDEPPVEPTLADLRQRDADPAEPPALATFGAFPAEAGVRFVEDLHEDGGWERVDEERRDPPASTRELLHPDAGGDDAPAPTFEAAKTLGKGWQRIATADIGELDTIALLRGGLEEEAARKAADGWRAGRFEVVGKGAQAQQCPPPCRKQSTSVMVWRWADAEQAQEFTQAFRRSFERSTEAKAEGGRGWKIEDGGAALVRAGRFSALVFAPDAPTAGRVAEAVLEG